MLDQAWTLSPGVALRPETFGALAYHFGNRKLIFLKNPELVQVVSGLTDAATVQQALDTAGIARDDYASYMSALTSLAEADMIRPRSEDCS